MRLRDVRLARAAVVRLRLLARQPVATDGVIFLFYHDMRGRDRVRFARQVRRLRDFGDLTGLSDAVQFLQQRPAGERRICLTFDDGEAGAFAHALPVLADADVPAAFFVVPGWIDAARPGVVGWDGCRAAASAGMEVGSHSLTHRRLSRLEEAEVAREMVSSRTRIEAELARPCLHFACPWGQAGADFDGGRDPALARAAGYRSFFTTHAQRAAFAPEAFVLPRVRMEPDWGGAELRYALLR